VGFFDPPALRGSTKSGVRYRAELSHADLQEPVHDRVGPVHRGHQPQSIWVPAGPLKNSSRFAEMTSTNLFCESWRYPFGSIGAVRHTSCPSAISISCRFSICCADQFSKEDSLPLMRVIDEFFPTALPYPNEKRSR
jgi:hypothetical protein